MKATGILWEGSSPLDGSPIVAIATDTAYNQKTGRMVQVYILRRDIPPTDAVRSGKDVSICGHCPMRSKDGFTGRACYVQVGQGPTVVYKAYQRGSYRPLDVSAFRGKAVRWGAYGDPAMLPPEIARAVNRVSAGWTGYTHQWRLPFASWTRGVFMASVETREQEARARSEGWGTFRAGAKDGSDKGRATLCAAERSGETCAECLKCDGSNRSIYIPAHGWGASFVPAQRLLKRKAG